VIAEYVSLKMNRTVRKETDYKNIRTPGSAGKLSTARTLSTAGKSATAGTPATAWMKATA
jgi:hypothetical protein